MQLLGSGDPGEVARPTAAGERLELLDVARGFAILGILLVNISGMKSAAWYSRFMWQPPQTEWPANRIADLFIQFFAEGKFITILSLLFGVGFGMLMGKAERTGDRFLLPRRFTFLLGLGLVHGLFIWHGDILTFYAISGFLLLPLRRCSPRALCIWAAVLYIGGAVFLTAFVAIVFAVWEAVGGQGTSYRSLQSLIEMSKQAYAMGSFGEIMRQRAIDFLAGGIFSGLWIPGTIALFALGVAAWKTGIPLRLSHSQPAARRVLAWAVPVALFSNGIAVGHASGIYGQTFLMWGVATFAHFVGPLSMAAVYLSLLVLAWGNQTARLLLHPFSLVGRMALTNYLLQSLIATTLFYSYGGGLFGQLSLVRGLLLTVLIWAVQMIVSFQWLKRFPMGPMEWCWRQWTYRGR